MGLEILGDVAYMCLIAETGPVVVSRERLFEYRIHESQSSKSIDESLMNRRAQFLLSIADGDSVKNRIQGNIRRIRMAGLLALALEHFRNQGFGFGMASLVSNYRSKNVGVRHLFGACILLFRQFVNPEGEYQIERD